MPHIIVKLFPGRSEEQKKELTDKIVKSVMETVNAGEESISVSFEEIPNAKLLLTPLQGMLSILVLLYIVGQNLLFKDTFTSNGSNRGINW